MLSPKLSEETNELEFQCKICEYKEKVQDPTEISSALIYRKDLKGGLDMEMVDPQLVNDPTMSRTQNEACLKCGQKNAIYYNAADHLDKRLKLIFICAAKGHDGQPCGFWWDNTGKHGELDTDDLEEKDESDAD